MSESYQETCDALRSDDRPTLLDRLNTYRNRIADKRAENAALKAANAELVEALRCSLVLVGSRFHASWDFDETILMARSMLAKHAAAQPPAEDVCEWETSCGLLT